jgi:DNA-binding protein Fis
MDKEELEEEIYILFNPEPDEDGFFPREWPHSRIKDFYKLDTSYIETSDWEGSSIHPHTRLRGPEEHRLSSLSRNMDIPDRLVEAGLKLFADSIIAYHDKKERKGNIRYYPSAIMTFWSGFETYVRYSSELMLTTVKDIPEVVDNYLLERQVYLDNKGEQHIRDKHHSTLDRYALLLKYGYSFNVERGNKYWQSLQRAKELRDYYTHLDVHEPRDVSSNNVLRYLESVMMALIWPSCELNRTVMLGIYRLYKIWARLGELQTEYIEQPFFKDWCMDGHHMFHCNFDNVDTSRFPNTKEWMEQRKQ